MGGLRLRRMGQRHFLTLKGEGGLCRKEWETEIPAWVFEQLWPLTEKKRLEKTRYRIAWGNRTLEVDEYHGPLAGLWTVECEFASEEEARAFVLPEWLPGARDVTLDPAYRNSSLAFFGLPSDAPVLKVSGPSEGHGG